MVYWQCKLKVYTFNVVLYACYFRPGNNQFYAVCNRVPALALSTKGFLVSEELYERPSNQRSEINSLIVLLWFTETWSLLNWLNKSLFTTDVRKPIKCRPFCLLSRNEVWPGALHYLRYLCNTLPTPSWEAASTSIKTTISWKQWWLGTWGRRMEIYFLFSQTPLVFGVSKAGNAHPPLLMLVCFTLWRNSVWTAKDDDNKCSRWGKTI